MWTYVERDRGTKQTYENSFVVGMDADSLGLFKVHHCYYVAHVIYTT